MKGINGLKTILLFSSCFFLIIGLRQTGLILYSDVYFVNDYIAHAIVTVGFLVLGFAGITKYIYDK